MEKLNLETISEYTSMDSTQCLTFGQLCKSLNLTLEDDFKIMNNSILYLKGNDSYIHLHHNQKMFSAFTLDSRMDEC